jgi:SAM-dependent methyltransferase
LENNISNEFEIIEKAALSNYKNGTPWPDKDSWHETTYRILFKYVSNWLRKNATKNHTILCAGAGTTRYKSDASIMYMDIVEEYIKTADKYLIGSVENILLPDQSIDIIICVGSVLNYVDAQKTISEFNRILKEKGILILEFERSTSAEFLFKSVYGQELFMQKYNYNNQQHFLWMYNEKFIIGLLRKYSIHVTSKYRFHCVSSVLYRMGFNEEKIAKWAKMDKMSQLTSYWMAHNIVLTAQKN